MRRLSFLVIFLIVVLTLKGQQKNSQKIQLLQENIAQLIGELDKETQLNYMKHINQVEGYKEGLWIESTNGKLWFINYKMGLKDGPMNAFYISGKKYIEADYKEGFIVGKVIFYDSKGVIEETFENITLNDTIVEVQREIAVDGYIYFTKEKHRYEYKAYIKKYTAEGVLYSEGFGLFDDDWTYGVFKIENSNSHEE